MKKHAITIIGSGTGDCVDTDARVGTPAWTEHPALREAGVIIGGKRLLEKLAGLPARKIPVGKDVAAVLAEAANLRENGERVVVLATGDPLFFGIGVSFAERFGPENLRIYPAVSSMQEGASRLALPWNAVTAVSLHGRNAFLPLAHALIAGNPVCVLTDALHTPARIAAYMAERGRTGYTAAVFANLGAPEESVWHGTLEDMGKKEFPNPNIVFLLPNAGKEPPALFPGRDEADFAHEKALITKWPVRAAALAALRIEPRHTVWDLGSGSGAVAVEAAALAYRGLVVAVEKEAARIAHSMENRRRFGAANMEIEHGDMLSLLPGLPAPDRVFIGGGLGSSRETADAVIRNVWSVLPPAGRLVISCVLLSSLEHAKEALVACNATFEITQIQASFSAPLSNDLRLRAANPVFLLAAQKM